MRLIGKAGPCGNYDKHSDLTPSSGGNIARRSGGESRVRTTSTKVRRASQLGNQFSIEEVGRVRIKRAEAAEAALVCMTQWQTHQPTWFRRCLRDKVNITTELRLLMMGGG